MSSKKNSGSQLSLSSLKNDFPAGLVVFLVALPLCLGIALASGAPLFAGIIAGVVGGIVVGIVSGSPLGVSGPAAGLTTIVLAAIVSFTPDFLSMGIDPATFPVEAAKLNMSLEDYTAKMEAERMLAGFRIFTVTVVLAGVIQVILGLVRAGIIGYYFPSAVIKGMLAAIGLILILKQIPHALGYDKDLVGDEDFMQKDKHNTFTEIYYALRFNSLGAVVITGISIGILILFDRPFMKKVALFKYVPGALIVVVLGILINYVYTLAAPDLVLKDEHLVVLPVAETPSAIAGFFHFPDWSALSNPKVYITALTIAIVASLESLLCVEATDKLDPDKRTTPTNRELIAQGTGNIVSGLVGGLPVTQVIVRSSANINAGGKTKLSAIIHGILLVGCALLIPVFLNKIPLACLAAILLMVGYKLAKVSLFKSMYKIGWDQFIPFIVTVIAILFTDLLKGIGIGMVVAIFYILRRNFRTSYFFHKENVHEGEVIRIKFSEEVTFLNKASIQLMLEELPENSKVLLDGTGSVNIDYDVLEIIQNFSEHGAKSKNISLELVNIPEYISSGGH
jgi:MFS superfamily sulfate permease-like transporter